MFRSLRQVSNYGSILGIPVHVTETATLNVKLEVGSVKETVEVTGEGEQLQTERARQAA